MSAVISIRGLAKTYASGLRALEPLDLDVEEGEIFALLGPNGAGKTTLISMVCGIVNPSGGTVTVAGHDIQRDYRAARALIGLVPQEIAADAFETVWNTVRFSRGLFGRPPNPGFIEQVLRDLSLWDKRASPIKSLSGGMKRRVMIAKALAHEPRVLFLDEPTAGVDVELRHDMWMLVRRLQEQGVTIILTTHYIDEAEEMADRVGVIDHGRLVLVEEKQALMRRFGQKRLVLELSAPLAALPAGFEAWDLAIARDGNALEYRYDTQAGHGDVAGLLRRLDDAGIDFRDLHTEQRSLEDIFVTLVGTRREAAP